MVYQCLSISINVCNQLFRTTEKTVKIFLPLFYFVMQDKKCPKRRIFGTHNFYLQNVYKVLDLCGFYGYYMSRYSGIVQSVEQRTVNPYVTGSSPVARAKISAGFRGFLFFSNLKLFPFSVPKYRQYLYYFYTRMHFGGYKNRFFCLYIFIHSRNPRFFDTLFFYDIQNSSPCVSSTKKSRFLGLLFFTDIRISISVIRFCLYRINFLHFWDTFWDTKIDFLFILFYTVFIHGRNLRGPAHYFF